MAIPMKASSIPGLLMMKIRVMIRSRTAQNDATVKHIMIVAACGPLFSVARRAATLGSIVPGISWIFYEREIEERRARRKA